MTLGSFWSSIAIKPNWVLIPPPLVSCSGTMNLGIGCADEGLPGFCIIPPGAGKPPPAPYLSGRRFYLRTAKGPNSRGTGSWGQGTGPAASQGYRRPRRINMHQGAIPGRWGNRLSQDLQASAPHAAAPPRWMRGGAACSPDWGWIRPVGQFSLCPLAGSRDCSKGASLGCPNSVLRVSQLDSTQILVLAGAARNRPSHSPRVKAVAVAGLSGRFEDRGG